MSRFGIVLPPPEARLLLSPSSRCSASLERWQLTAAVKVRAAGEQPRKLQKRQQATVSGPCMDRDAITTSRAARCSLPLEVASDARELGAATGSGKWQL